MGRKPPRRRAGPSLTVPPELLDAIGPVDPEQIAPAVAAIQAGLTSGSWLGRPYLDDTATRTAYRTYYLCANAPKIAAVLDRLALPQTLDVLELGAGPGTGVAAVALWARRTGRTVRHRVTDVLEANLRAAQRLAERLGVEIETRRLDLRERIQPGPRYDLVLATNVVCELPRSLDARLVDDFSRLTRDGGTTLVIDPASREASGRSLALRDAMVAAGWTPRWPCPHAHGCPTGWCHAEWRFERPAFMAEVDRRVGTRREVLKATCYALTRGEVVRPSGLARVVSERRDEKGRSTLHVCRDGAEVLLERQKRDRGELNADFGSAARFDLLETRGGTEVGGRLRIGREDRCVRVEDGPW